MTINLTRSLSVFRHRTIFVVSVAILLSLAATAQVRFSRFDTATGLTLSGNLAIGDFNRDGKPDMVVTSGYGVYLLLGHGDGTFSAPQQIFSGCCGFVAGDLNGDGKLDLAFSSGGLCVLLGNGDGTFAFTPICSTAPITDRAPFLFDINKDGKLDAVLVQQGGGIGVGLGNGDGTFGSFTILQITGGYEAIAVAAADFNGDGKIDLAATNPGAPRDFKGTTVSLFLGNGDGTFGPPTDSTVGSYPSELVAADLNGDGKMDLAVSNYVGSSVSVLLGKGDGTFQPKEDLPFGASPWDIAAVDLEGAGILDIAVADGPLSIARGLGDGTFLARQDFAIPGFSQTMLAGDMNSDGRPDVVVLACCSSDKISVFLNTHPRVASSTSVVTSGSPSVIGQPVTFTATVTSISWKIPDGELVAFYDGTAFLGSVPLTAGRAAFTTSSLSARTHAIHAKYAGGAAFKPSKNKVIQVVQP